MLWCDQGPRQFGRDHVLLLLGTDSQGGVEVERVAGTWDTRASGSSCVIRSLQEQVPHVPAGPGAEDLAVCAFP